MKAIKDAPKKEQKKEVAQATQNGKSTAKEQKVDKVKPIEKEVEKIIQSLKPSAEDRIRNAENFGILTKKFEHLKSKNEELKKFKISSDGSKEELKLKNSTGFEFTVSNSQIIHKAVEVFQNDLDRLLSDAQKEVQEFII